MTSFAVSTSSYQRQPDCPQRPPSRVRDPPRLVRAGTRGKGTLHPTGCVPARTSPGVDPRPPPAIVEPWLPGRSRRNGSRVRSGRSASSWPTTLPRARGARARARGRATASSRRRRAATATRCWRRSRPSSPMSCSPTSACRRRATTRGSRSPHGCATTHPSIGVVVLSQYADPRYGLALLESGSDGRAYLLKERLHDRAQLVAAIEAVAARRLGRRREGRRGADRGARAGRALAAGRADAARARDPLRDRAGQEQPGDRRAALPHQARRREAHQRDLPQARPTEAEDFSRRVKAALDVDLSESTPGLT